MNTANHPPDAEEVPSKGSDAAPNGTAVPPDARAVQNGTPTPEAAAQDEFPFDAPPGTAGVSPTNELAAAVAVARTPPKTASPDAISEAEPQPPSDRRGVQFASAARNADQSTTPTARVEQRDFADEGELHTRERSSARLFSRLKALAGPMAGPGHRRSSSVWTVESAPDPSTREHDDADAESNAEEDVQATPSRLRSKVRAFSSRLNDGPSTAPTTPRALRFPGFGRSASERSPQASTSRPSLGRNVMSDIPENRRLAMSEDEGRTRKQPTGRKRSSGFRRMISQGDALGSPGRRGGDRSSARWRHLKAGLRLMSKKKEDHRLDHAKSAELIAQLLSGAPAALMLASMFQRDEKNRKRIPVLLDQLKINVTDSLQSKEDNRRRLTFRIELEYASALMRMKWVIHRTWRDFANLHLKYKIHHRSEGLKHLRLDHLKIPRFPRRAVPYLRNMRGLYEDDDEDNAGEAAPEGEDVAVDHAANHSAIETEASEPDRPAPRRRSSISFVRRTASAFGPDLSRLGSSFNVFGGVGANPADDKLDTYAETTRKRLELYLHQFINYVMFSPESNRLCKFLELSSLGVRLAPEASYHGKEGFLTIKSSKGVDFRKSFKPRLFWNRHSPKWFLVRHSYIVCVDGPDQLKIYDVFLVDPSFAVERKKAARDEPEEEENDNKTTSKKPRLRHELKITNSERVTKLIAHHKALAQQFEESIQFMLKGNPWAAKHRFDSFAPVRSNVWARFLVDGQDYMWNVSRAIDNAREVIYIHDWWLTPELYLRRPACISGDWRLDRLLKRKADEGVKIFIIVYRNVESAIPINSDWTKHVLVNLGPNVCIQRSPNQLRQNTFFWAHHEKLLVVDHCVAFCGGVDLCFGRWDAPDHRVADDKLTGFEEGDFPRDSDHCQLWPGKDYSNPRVQDFYTLDKPYEEMYDRTKVPRMPWHDVGMQMVGQPARDLSRHFVQRWNFLLRQRDSERPRPMLLPPPDFLPSELEDLQLNGTCRVQLLRSACEWSLGIMGRVEHSIMDAYVESIRESEHLVYIENQFFITSCEVGDTKIENRIGDALVERIVRAARNGEKWLAIVVIPLVPGFQNTVDSIDGTSVRLIMQCQFYSICQGDSSVFGRLRAAGVDPREYIDFYALRAWGVLGPDRALVTEQLYIHAKIMVVDDRIAIIGSANINERSMLGSRDSEVAAIVEDADMVPSRMAGEPYMVSRFAHDFRMRLMREHLGLDVDRVSTAKLTHHGNEKDPDEEEADLEKLNPAEELAELQELERDRRRNQDAVLRAERREQQRHGREAVGGSAVDGAAESSHAARPPERPLRQSTQELGLPQLQQLPPLPDSDDTDIGGPPLYRPFASLPQSAASPASPSSSAADLDAADALPALFEDMSFPVVTTNCMLDPLAGSFARDVWRRVAENNTRIFRGVFRCMPDSDVRTWGEYKDYDKFYAKFKEAQHGAGGAENAGKEMGRELNKEAGAEAHAAGEHADAGAATAVLEKLSLHADGPHASSSTVASAVAAAVGRSQSKRAQHQHQQGRRRGDTSAGANSGVASRAGEHAQQLPGEFPMLDKAQAEHALKHVQGHLVAWPYDWLSSEMAHGRWNHAVDNLAPLEI
jgi:phospholipase D1/2